MVHIHGKFDEKVLYEGGSGQKGFLVNRVDLSNESVPFWVNRNSCSTTHIVEESSNGEIEIRRYAGSCQDTQVLLVTLHSGTHSWANMSDEVSEEIFRKYGQEEKRISCLFMNTVNGAGG